MMRTEKASEEIKIWVGETLKADLKVLAGKEGHDKLSTYIRKVLKQHCYGYCGTDRDLLAGLVSDE